MDMTVQISKGNTKLGLIPSVSLTPSISCADNVPCSKYCYAKKSYRMYPAVRYAWDKNTYLAKSEPDKYFSDIADYLQNRKPLYFRWHVAGDILNQEYFKRMKAIAKAFPETNFLAFTKRHNLNFNNTPNNLTVRFSYWTGWGDVKEKVLKAWYQDGKELRVSEKVFTCGGSCRECKVCWDKKVKEVMFHKH